MTRAQLPQFPPLENEDGDKISLKQHGFELWVHLYVDVFNKYIRKFLEIYDNLKNIFSLAYFIVKNTVDNSYNIQKH